MFRKCFVYPFSILFKRNHLFQWSLCKPKPMHVQVQQLVQTGRVHPRLVLNYDQVWSTAFRPARRTLQKDPSQRGVFKDPLYRSCMLKQIRHNVERSLDLPLTESDPSIKVLREHLPQPRIQGGAAASASVEAWRIPRSVTTLSFIDGHVGRSYITVKAGTLPEEARLRLNQELSKYIFIDLPQERSHVWNQETMVRYLDHLGKETCYSETYPHGLHFHIFAYIYIYTWVHMPVVCTYKKISVNCMMAVYVQHICTYPQGLYRWNKRAAWIQELRLRRRQLGLSASSRALCFYDQASAHMSLTFKQILKNWETENNCETCLVL